MGSVEIDTARNAFAGESFASVKPKSVVAKTRGVSSVVVSVALVPDGASLTEVMLTVLVPCAVSAPPLP